MTWLVGSGYERWMMDVKCLGYGEIIGGNLLSGLFRVLRGCRQLAVSYFDF